MQVAAAVRGGHLAARLGEGGRRVDEGAALCRGHPRHHGGDLRAAADGDLLHDAVPRIGEPHQPLAPVARVDLLVGRTDRGEPGHHPHRGGRVDTRPAPWVAELGRCGVRGVTPGRRGVRR